MKLFLAKKLLLVRFSPLNRMHIRSENLTGIHYLPVCPFQIRTEKRIFATIKFLNCYFHDMESQYITVAYRLYVMGNGQKELIEEAPEAHPFQFISGMGYTLDRFEKEITALKEGDNFNFTIPCAEAYGERDEDNVRQVSKAMFCRPDGKFDSENIFPGNIIMLNDNEGHRFYANVGEVTEDKVVIDLNHPQAGKDLIFEGKVIEIRPATNKEIEILANAMAKGCGGCGNCGGDCSEGEHRHGEEGCCGGGCGHCH